MHLEIRHPKRIYYVKNKTMSMHVIVKKTKAESVFCLTRCDISIIALLDGKFGKQRWNKFLRIIQAHSILKIIHLKRH